MPRPSADLDSEMTPTTRWLAVGLASAVALLSLLPLASLGLSWASYVRDVGLPLDQTPALGYDGVRWEDRDDQVFAAYVVRRGTADEAGLRQGDVLLALDYRPVESAAEAEAQVDRATGTILTYSVQRRSATSDVQVRIVRDPTFLYPLSAPLWATTGWGFAVVTLLHLIAYLTVAPLAARSVRARRSRLLIGAALLWVGGNLLRVAWVSTLGAPPGGGGLRAIGFDSLTLIALGGWIAYPALLLDQSLRDRRVIVALGRWRRVLMVPPALLGVGVLVATLFGHIGPLPPDAFAVPILFYVCVYVGVATGVTAVIQERRDGSGVAWGRLGNAVVVLVATVGAVIAWTQLGLGSREADIATAWFVVLFQLFSLLPVALVSYTVLRYGAFDALLVRTLATLATLSLAFVVVSLAAAVLNAVLPGGAQPVALGVTVVVLLLVAEWISPAIRERARASFRTARQRSRQRLDRLGEEIRTIVDLDSLAEHAANRTGEALQARSAVVFLRTGDAEWTKATYRPEAPTFTQVDLGRVWDRIRDEGRVWSRNEELNDSAMPTGIAERLRRLGAAVAVPVTTGRGVPVGLIVLGRKERRLSVYNTEDIDRLRALAGQLALAVERLRLLDRERDLVRQTSQAEMVALRAQINPHFLFNALNTVAALIRDKPGQAEETVEHLAGLFRDVLTASGHSTIPLRDEMRLVERYLMIEQARFGDALAVEIDLDDSVQSVTIPAFAVQTLVENAVKHGIERKRGGGRVTVAAHRAADRLEISVTDTGVGLAPGTPYGVGLNNVSDRLALLYADAATLDVSPLDEGTQSHLSIPLDP